MKLYENIKKYRNEKGLSQEQLAELMGYSAKQNRTPVFMRLRTVFCVLYASCEPCFILSYLVLFLIQKKEPATVPK